MILPVSIEGDSANSGLGLAIALTKLLGNFVGDGLVQVMPFSDNTCEGSLATLAMEETVSHCQLLEF